MEHFSETSKVQNNKSCAHLFKEEAINTAGLKWVHTMYFFIYLIGILTGEAMQCTKYAIKQLIFRDNLSMQLQGKVKTQNPYISYTDQVCSDNGSGRVCQRRASPTDCQNQNFWGFDL